MLNKCSSIPHVMIPEDQSSFVMNTTTRTSRRRMIHQNVTVTCSTIQRRRARSISPIRTSPRIVHTNGRLDQPVMVDSETHDSTMSMPLPKKNVRRAVSCDQASSKKSTKSRMRIYYSNDTLRKRCEENQERLFQFVQGSTSSTTTGSDNSLDKQQSTSFLLAKKALKYRKVFDKIKEADLNDPAFDVSKCLGVMWCKRS